jgi:hypothetical protein
VNPSKGSALRAETRTRIASLTVAQFEAGKVWQIVLWTSSLCVFEVAFLNIISKAQRLQDSKKDRQQEAPGIVKLRESPRQSRGFT